MTDVDVRRRVFDFVRRYPAVHVREVERQLGLPDRLAAYHLASLERDRRVRRIEEAGFTRFIARPTLAKLSRRDIPFLCLMRRGPALQITLALLERSEQSHGELQDGLGLAKASTSYHLAALLAAGIVSVRRQGRERHYALVHAQYARRMIESYRPTPGLMDEFSSLWDDLFPKTRARPPP